MPGPCVVIGHGLGLTRRSGLLPVAEAFAEEGYAALVFDYRTFGESDGEPRQVIAFENQLEDWASAIRFARERDDVDSTAVAVWGFSLGGGHAVATGARDSDLAGVVAVAPMLSGLSATLAAMRWWSLWTMLRLVFRGLRDCLSWLLGRTPVQVPLSAPTGEIGLLTSPDAYPGYLAIVPEDFDFGTAARTALYFWSYSPGRALRRVGAPVLIVPASQDKVCPPEPTRRRARAAPGVEIEEVDCEHMAVLTPPVRDQVLNASLGFLKRHVPVAS